MNKAILISLFVLLMSIAYAIECENTWTQNVNCNFTTTPLSCTTYDLINETGDLTVDGGGLVLLYGSIYYQQFNATDIGKNVIVLCDNTTSVIDVQGYSLNTINSNLTDIKDNTVTSLANQATIDSKIGDPLGNSTTLWDYMWGSLTDGENKVNLLYRIWQYAWRTNTGIQT